MLRYLTASYSIGFLQICNEKGACLPISLFKLITYMESGYGNALLMENLCKNSMIPPVFEPRNPSIQGIDDSQYATEKLTIRKLVMDNRSMQPIPNNKKVHKNSTYYWTFNCIVKLNK